MPSIADLYSTIDSYKRRAADVLSDPQNSLMQMLGYANDRARNYNESLAQASKERGYGPKTQELAQAMAEAYNPVGMMVPAAKDIAFKAAMLEKKGLNPQEIHKELGVHRGPADKQWRQELNDSSSFVKGTGTFEDTVMKRMTALGKDKTAEPVTVGDVFHHPDLFKHYPELKDIEVRFLPKDSKVDGRTKIYWR